MFWCLNFNSWSCSRLKSKVGNPESKIEYAYICSLSDANKLIFSPKGSDILS